MSLFGGLFRKKTTKDEELDIMAKAPIKTESDHDEDEIAAVIAATMAAMEEEEEIAAAITAALTIVLGKDTSEFIVRSIKRTSEVESIWAHVGRIQLMR